MTGGDSAKAANGAARGGNSKAATGAAHTKV